MPTVQFYIGQTGRELRERMTLHRQQIQTDHLRFLPVSKHIHSGANNDFYVIPIYQATENVIQRESKETVLINILKLGLNSSQ